MNFKIEAEIDWLGEDSGLDETIQGKIIEAVTAKIQAQIVTDVAAQVTKTINERVNELVSETFARIMSKKINVTDQWGDVKESFPTIEDAIKTRFDRFMLEKVNNDGKVDSYGANQTRINWIIDGRIKNLSEEFTKKAVTQINDAVKTQLSEALKNELGDRLTKLLKVDKLIGDGK